MVQALITACPSAAVAIVGLYLFITGKIHGDPEFRRLLEENQALRKALNDERLAANEAAKTGTLTNQLVEGLIKVATDPRKPLPPGESSKPLDLVPGDLG
jgi:hypothetical protein